MHQRILLLGTTGIKKKSIAENVKNVLNSDYGHNIQIIDFEKEYFKKTNDYRNMSGFLTIEKNWQHLIWNDAWKMFSADLEGELKNTPIILILHGAYVNEGYGVRSFIDFNYICKDFQPSLIVTLIDDIYNMWWRTEAHADGDNIKGRPSIEQLLMARRTEITIGDLIAYQNSLTKPARHIVCSVNHPVGNILKLVLFNAKVAYLSFPISEPRKLSRNGDNSFIDAINCFHNSALNRNSNKVIYISPLAIDELPLCTVANPVIQNIEQEKNEIEKAFSLDKERKKEELKKLANSEKSTIVFDRSKRWPLSDLWKNSDLLCDNAPKVPTTIEIPASQLHNICGIIKTDIGWRDYKLVDQADALSIFCPIPPGREEVTRGVMGEWQKAMAKSTPC